VLDDHGAAQRAAFVPQHVFQDAELLGRQVDGFRAARDFAADAIEGEVGHLQLFRHRLAAPQQRPHARQQLDKRKGFHQVVVGALFEALDAVIEAAAGAQDQDRRPHLRLRILANTWRPSISGSMRSRTTRS